MTGIPVLDREPEEIVSGDTIKWKRSFSDFPASVWALTYELRGISNTGTAIKLTASTDGDDYSVSVPASTTAGWIAGEYSWDAYVSSGTDRMRVDRGLFKVLRDLASADADFDDRSTARKSLSALEAVKEGRASEYDLEYEVSGRSLKKMSWSEIIEAFNHFKSQVEIEDASLRRKKGLGTGNKIRTRFISS